MAAKSCVYCTGELKPVAPPQRAKGGKFTRVFVCKSCSRRQSKLLEANDPYADGVKRGRKPKGAPNPSSIALSPVLAAAKPTPKSLASHAYQRKLAAHYAPHILPVTFQALHDGVVGGNAQIIGKVLELYELIQTDKRISIVNDNRSVNIDNRTEGAAPGEGRRSFEATARMLEAAREKRLAQGNPLAIRVVDVDTAATPEGLST